MWIKNNFFKYSLGIVVILVIIFFLGQINFFLEPFKRLLATILFPILTAGLLYYLFRPLVRLMLKLKLPPVLAIMAVFLIFIAGFSLIGTYAGSLIAKQFQQLIKDMPQIIQTLKDKGVELLNTQSFAALFTGRVEEQLASYLQKIIPAVSGSLLGAISTITSIATVMILVPFILFYLLKDDQKFLKGITNAIPVKYRNEVIDILRETDKTLSAYIIGQAIIALILGALTYIGYVIIGLNYAFILAVFVLITSFIPMFGAIIGVIPAFFVGLAANPFMGVKVLIIMIVVQQIEGNLISPNIIGKRLDIHPLTIILIFLGAASLYGFIGMLIAVPAYAVLKVIGRGAINVYKIWKYQGALTRK